MNTYIAIVGGARFPVTAHHGYLLVAGLGSPRIVHYNKPRGHWWILVHRVYVPITLRVQANGRWVQ